MPEFRTEPLVVPTVSGLLPEGERDRRVALTSFRPATEAKAIPQREVICYECGRRSSVPAAALSATCIHCHTHLSMADVELKSGARRLTIRTVGNVTVPPDVDLSHLSIACHNMTVQGRVSGSFRCSGTMTLANTMRISGRIRAAELVVEKEGDVVLTEGGEVKEAMIRGRLTGELTARRISIAPGGELIGHSKADEWKIQPGGIRRG